jgi:hypothetical protein
VVKPQEREDVKPREIPHTVLARADEVIGLLSGTVATPPLHRQAAR